MLKRAAKKIRPGSVYVQALLLLWVSLLLWSKIPVSAQEQLTAVNSSTCQNYISIEGATNINSFSLEQNVPKDLVCGPGDSRWLPIPEEELYLITIPVRNFNANNRIVYKDFLDLVNARKHPYIQIFIEEEEFLKFFNGQMHYNPVIGVIVSGETQKYRISCIVAECFNDNITIRGYKEVKLTDFKLAPPEKSLGLIKVHDELIINFEFSMPEEQHLKLTLL